MQACVIDTCSLLHSFHVQIGGKGLNELIGEHFRVLLPETVVREMPRALRRAYPQWKERELVESELSEIIRLHAAWTASRVSHADVTVELDGLKKDGIRNLGDGEMQCLALVRHTADESVSYVVFLTDDYEAGEEGQKLCDKYQTGTVVRMADLVVFFGIRYGIGRTSISQSLRNVVSFYTMLYESVLVELESHLPKAWNAMIMSQVKRGLFEQAAESISKLPLKPSARLGLGELVDEVRIMAADQSIVGHTINRLRSLTELHL